ncbi:mechanosensitive ion channel family protein [Oscillatoria sp. CS-180]|nr:mechanosensitive ion channel family protein [Oscillatoria sp. CS-180]
MTALPGWANSPVLMQFPGTGGGGNSSYTLGWVGLDGYDVFQVAAPQSIVTYRSQQIQNNLEQIRDQYLSLENPSAIVSNQPTDEGQPKVYVNTDYLMTITQEDANLQGTTASALVERLGQTIPNALARSYQERQPAYRERQFIYAGIAVGVAMLAILLLSLLSDPLLRWSMRGLSTTLNQNTVSDNQQHNLEDIRELVLPVLQLSLIASAVLWTLGRFPETRAIQEEVLSGLKVPIIILIVVVVAYVGVRLTYAIIDKLLIRMTDEEGLSGTYSRRTRLRISTLSSVIKNIANFVWIAIGFVIALSVTGIEIGLLLASVGIIGLALSLATQNLVQGAIKGFFIVLEDQFAIGDVVKIGEDAGVVENLNLRITQLRDAEGRLITIPTDEITRVANYSLLWSRADLKLPVHYNADIDQMIEIARQVGNELKADPEWGELILEDPQILGVDDFGDSALIIRVWIKTQPMKQWDVSREYRRRFMLTVQESDNPIPFPQRDIWLHSADELMVNLKGGAIALENNGSEKSSDQKTEHNGKRTEARTDRQPRTVPSDDDSEGSDADGDGDGGDR